MNRFFRYLGRAIAEAVIAGAGAEVGKEVYSRVKKRKAAEAEAEKRKDPEEIAKRIDELEGELRDLRDALKQSPDSDEEA